MGSRDTFPSADGVVQWFVPVQSVYTTLVFYTPTHKWQNNPLPILVMTFFQNTVSYGTAVYGQPFSLCPYNKIVISLTLIFLSLFVWILLYESLSHGRWKHQAWFSPHTESSSLNKNWTAFFFILPHPDIILRLIDLHYRELQTFYKIRN